MLAFDRCLIQFIEDQDVHQAVHIHVGMQGVEIGVKNKTILGGSQCKAIAESF